MLGTERQVSRESYRFIDSTSSLYPLDHTASARLYQNNELQISEFSPGPVANITNPAWEQEAKIPVTKERVIFYNPKIIVTG